MKVEITKMAMRGDKISPFLLPATDRWNQQGCALNLIGFLRSFPSSSSPVRCFTANIKITPCKRLGCDLQHGCPGYATCHLFIKNTTFKNTAGRQQDGGCWLPAAARWQRRSPPGAGRQNGLRRLLTAYGRCGPGDSGVPCFNTDLREQQEEEEIKNEAE